MVASSLDSRVLAALLGAAVICTVSADKVVTAPHKVIFKVENLENGKPAEFIVEVHPEWAPLAAERFMNLVKQHHFDGSRFHGVLSGFAAYFGIASDPRKQKNMSRIKLEDEPRLETNTRGKIAFVPDGPNSRSTQLVISEKHNEYLDREGYVPFAVVSGGMAVVDRLYRGYGARGPPKGRGPAIERIEKEGVEYLTKEFPKMSYIRTALIMEENFPQVLVNRESSFSTLPLALVAFVAAAVAGGGYLCSSTLTSKNEHMWLLSGHHIHTCRPKNLPY